MGVRAVVGLGWFSWGGCGGGRGAFIGGRFLSSPPRRARLCAAVKTTAAATTGREGRETRGGRRSHSGAILSVTRGVWGGGEGEGLVGSVHRGLGRLRLTGRLASGPEPYGSRGSLLPWTGRDGRCTCPQQIQAMCLAARRRSWRCRCGSPVKFPKSLYPFF